MCVCWCQCNSVVYTDCCFCLRCSICCDYRALGTHREEEEEGNNNNNSCLWDFTFFCCWPPHTHTVRVCVLLDSLFAISIHPHPHSAHIDIHPSIHTSITSYVQCAASVTSIYHHTNPLVWSHIASHRSVSASVPFGPVACCPGQPRTRHC